jgi:hypothetical protein
MEYSMNVESAMDPVFLQDFAIVKDTSKIVWDNVV